MSNIKRSLVVTPALLALVAGVAFAGDLDPTGQAGQYQSTVNTVIVKGQGGEFAPSTVYVPFIIPNDQTSGANSINSFLNGAVVENINGTAYGSVTTFGATGTVPGTNAPRVVSMLGTIDGDPRLSTLTSNNTIVDEGARNLSNSLGTLLPDGTLFFSERFATGGGFAQNNIAGFNSAHTLGVAPVIGGPNKVVTPTTVNYGNAAETAINPQTATVRGSAFLGVPSIIRVPSVSPVAGTQGDENLLTGFTTFNGLPTLTAVQQAAATNGVVIFDGLNNNPETVFGPTVTANCGIGPGLTPPPGLANSYTPLTGPNNTLAYWLQNNVPVPTNPAGECYADARQTKPVLTLVRTPGGRDLPYVLHGIGFSGGTPFSAGSARPLMLAVDTVIDPITGAGTQNYTGSNPTASFNTILIEADAAGGVGSTHGRPYDSVAPLSPGFADHFNTNPNQQFVDAQATGGGGGQSTLSQFDMNARGQVVALWGDEGVSPRRYEIRVYNPIWDAANDRIEGYTLANIITFTGDVDNAANPLIVSELRTTINDGVAIFEAGLVPLSGPAIDDEGRVSFIGVTEKFDETGNFDGVAATPDTVFLNNTTSSLFVWEPTTNTLHRVLSGGQNGDVLADAFPASGNPLNESLALGFFPVDAASDTFGRDSFSRTGGHLAVNFRSGGNQTNNGVNVELETLPNGVTADNFDDNGGVLTRGVGPTLNERAVRGTAIVTLGRFIAAPVCCLGDADSSGSVNFGDITAVLANLGSVGTVGQQNPGDADCSGAVNFTDITIVLANLGSNCN